MPTMPEKGIILNRLGNNVVEEAQLLAEKKWIILALDECKHQRNCLQIERLHLESMKVKLKDEPNATVNEMKGLKQDMNIPETSAANLMQSAPKNTEINNMRGMSVTDEEIICNEQELDLLISDYIYGSADVQYYNNIEEDEESDDDIMVDINMLMNGYSK